MKTTWPLLLFLNLIFTDLYAGDPVLPVLNQPIADISTVANDPGTTIDLGAHFGTEVVDSQVVRFSSQTSNGSRVMEFALFSTRTPNTRTNFLKYVSDGDYNHSIIHRSVPGFVIQGGGFYSKTPGEGLVVDSVSTDPPIVNEFGVSNTYSTVSMAKLGGDPDSATSQWFVSLGANSDILDPQNGGFTVFGRVTQSTMQAAADFGNRTLFPVWNAGGAFSELPLIASFDGSVSIVESDLILFPSVTMTPMAPGDAGESVVLAYTVQANSNSSGVSASIINDNQLQISYPPQSVGGATLTIRATDSVGNIVDDVFVIQQNYSSWRTSHFTPSDAADDAVSGPQVDSNGDGLSNMRLYIHGLLTTEVQSDPVSFEESVSGNSYFPSFTFPLTKQIKGVSILLQKSRDLGSSDPWTNVSYSQVSSIPSGATDMITIKANDAVTGNKVFYRVHFTLTQ